MWSHRLRPTRATTALFLLVVLGAVFAGQFVHTDDGCAVETHCGACRQAVTSIAVTTPPLVLAPASDPVIGAAPVAATIEISRVTFAREPSRGPPRA